MLRPDALVVQKRFLDGSGGMPGSMSELSSDGQEVRHGSLRRVAMADGSGGGSEKKYHWWDVVTGQDKHVNDSVHAPLEKYGEAPLIETPEHPERTRKRENDRIRDIIN